MAITMTPENVAKELRKRQHIIDSYARKKAKALDEMLEAIKELQTLCTRIIDEHGKS